MNFTMAWFVPVVAVFVSNSAFPVRLLNVKARVSIAMGTHAPFFLTLTKCG